MFGSLVKLFELLVHSFTKNTIEMSSTGEINDFVGNFENISEDGDNEKENEY